MKTSIDAPFAKQKISVAYYQLQQDSITCKRDGAV